MPRSPGDTAVSPRGGALVPVCGPALLVVAAICVSLGVATLLLGTVQIRWADMTLFRNSHVARPLVLAIILATLAGRGPMAAHVLVPAVVFVSLMPVASYSDALTYMRQERHPLRTARDCLLGVRSSRAGRRPRCARASMRSAKPVVPAPVLSTTSATWAAGSEVIRVDIERVDRGLFSPGAQRPLLLPDDATIRA